MKNNQIQNNIFILGGRTGGPLIPNMAIANAISDSYSDYKFQKIIFGVKNGFETSYYQNEIKKLNPSFGLDLQIFYLPEVKLGFLSFKVAGFFPKMLKLINTFFTLFTTFFTLFYSVSRCIFFIIKFKPVLILNCGSFLAPPMIFAAVFLKKLSLSKAVIVTHQQDPMPGISNKLTNRLSDIQTAVFQYTIDNYPIFKNSTIIPNPIDHQKFTIASKIGYQNEKLGGFISNKKGKIPIILVYGGGSGSKNINNFIQKNIPNLSKKFAVVHLLGTLQSQGDMENWHNLGKNCENYLCLDFLIGDMAKLILDANVVISRAGLGSIGELLFLKKAGILIPLLNSHQELNAKIVEKDFLIMPENKLEIEKIIDFSRSAGFQNKSDLKWEYLPNTLKITTLIWEKIFKLLDKTK